jgi:hypothetical protein
MRHSDSVALGVEADIARTPKNRSLVTRLRHRLGFDFDPTMLCTGSMNITLHGAEGVPRRLGRTLTPLARTRGNTGVAEMDGSQ